MNKLTHKEIDAMEAGREMDALVGLYIFGHEAVMRLVSRGEGESNEIESLYDGSYGYTKDDLAEMYKNVGNGYVNIAPCFVIKHDDGFDDWNVISYYSTDIVAAFRALETFDRVEWDIEIVSDTEDEGELWGVSLNKYTMEPIGIVAIGSAASALLPHAISKAMLKAVMGKE